MAASVRVQQIVALVSELNDAERDELVAEIARLEDADPKRARLAQAIERVVRDHPRVLAALSK